MAGRGHSPVTIMGKIDSFWGNQLSLLPIKLEQYNEKYHQIL